MSSPTPAETSAGVAVGLHRRIPMRISRPSAIRKKLQSPQSHIPQAIYCSPCLADPHAPRIPMRAISPYHHSLTMCPPRPARPVPQTRHPPVSTNSLRLRRRAARRRRQRMSSPRDVGDGVAGARGAALRLQARLGADRYSMPWGMLLRYLLPACGRATALGEGGWSKISDLGA